MHHAHRLLSTYGRRTCWLENSRTVAKRPHAQTIEALRSVSVRAFNLYALMVHVLVCLQLLVRSVAEDVGCNFYQRDEDVVFNHTSNIWLARIQTTRMLEHTGDCESYGRVDNFCEWSSKNSLSMQSEQVQSVKPLRSRAKILP